LFVDDDFLSISGAHCEDIARGVEVPPTPFPITKRHAPVILADQGQKTSGRRLERTLRTRAQHTALPGTPRFSERYRRPIINLLWRRLVCFLL
jgi:hypothetical protein